MAMETAVVATSVGATAEMVRDDVDGLLVPPGDVEAMAAAIRRTMTDRDATRRRVASARERVETTLSFAERTRTVEAIYEELVASR
jgi:glycosyltransferase involved in cell wall biosynthesis